MTLLTESLIYYLVAVVLTVTVVVVAYIKWKRTFWDKFDIPTLPTSFSFGNTKNLLLTKKTFGEEMRDIYKDFKKKGHTRHAGIYFGATPFYFLIDPEMVKTIMQNDFQYFVNHANYINEEADPLSGHLFSLEDAKWKNMRVKLTPTFTSGKMKMMFQVLADCTVGLTDILDKSVKNKAPVDIKEILARFTTDIIGSAAFGLECNSLKNPDSEFRLYGKKMFERTFFTRLRLLITFLIPHEILHALGYRITGKDIEQFFMKVIRDTVEYRENNNIYRKDFMHLLLQLKNRGTVADDEKITDEHGSTKEKALTINELAAQAFVFFIAGFETSSTAMTFALYELAINHNIQEKVREEINTILARYDNKLTYEAVMQMTYMEKVINEALRKYPPVPVLTRKCSKDYKVPNSSVVIKKGMTVGIPILGLHTDPEYFPNPEKFKPERFSDENKRSRHPFTWIPFGEGPRACIGLRFGMLQTRVGLAAL